MEHPAHGLEDVPLIKVLNELGHHLGVCLGGKGHALVRQELLKLCVILNDAVVHHGNAPAAAHLGVGVHIRRHAVGGPPGMADAQGAMDGRAALDHVGQYPQAALGLGDIQLLSVKNSHARRVVPPVFQPTQTVQQNGRGLLAANKSDNTAHNDSS